MSPYTRPSFAESLLALDAALASAYPLRLLLVEDNPTVCKVAELVLSRMGYRADVAGTGAAAIAALERQPYDLVLMDVRMPEMDGLDAARAIRRTHPDPRIPWIIGMTADTTAEGRARCLAAGMNDYVPKPLDPIALRDALVRAATAARGPAE